MVELPQHAFRPPNWLLASSVKGIQYRRQNSGYEEPRADCPLEYAFALSPGRPAAHTGQQVIPLAFFVFYKPKHELERLETRLQEQALRPDNTASSRSEALPLDISSGLPIENWSG